MDQVQLRLELVKLTHANGSEARHVLERCATYEAWINGEVENLLDAANRLIAEGTPKGSS